MALKKDLPTYIPNNLMLFGKPYAVFGQIPDNYYFNQAWLQVAYILSVKVFSEF